MIEQAKSTGLKLLCSEAQLKTIQENNDKGHYEKMYLPTAVIHDLLRDVRYLIGEVERLEKYVSEGCEACYDDIKRADELRGQVSELQKELEDHKRYKTALRKIVCLNIPMPDEVFNIANGVLEGIE